MTNDIAKFTLRIDAELLKKFRFIADYNARSANRELEVLMKKHIAEFEKENGKIIQRVEQSPTPPVITICYFFLDH